MVDDSLDDSRGFTQHTGPRLVRKEYVPQPTNSTTSPRIADTGLGGYAPENAPNVKSNWRLPDPTTKGRLVSTGVTQLSGNDGDYGHRLQAEKGYDLSTRAGNSIPYDVRAPSTMKLAPNVPYPEGGAGQYDLFGGGKLHQGNENGVSQVLRSTGAGADIRDPRQLGLKGAPYRGEMGGSTWAPGPRTQYTPLQGLVNKEQLIANGGFSAASPQATRMGLPGNGPTGNGPTGGQQSRPNVANMGDGGFNYNKWSEHYTTGEPAWGDKSLRYGNGSPGTMDFIKKGYELLKNHPMGALKAGATGAWDAAVGLTGHMGTWAPSIAQDAITNYVAAKEANNPNVGRAEVQDAISNAGGGWGIMGIMPNVLQTALGRHANTTPSPDQVEITRKDEVAKAQKAIAADSLLGMQGTGKLDKGMTEAFVNKNWDARVDPYTAQQNPAQQNPAQHTGGGFNVGDYTSGLSGRAVTPELNTLAPQHATEGPSRGIAELHAVASKYGLVPKEQSSLQDDVLGWAAGKSAMPEGHSIQLVDESGRVYQTMGKGGIVHTVQNQDMAGPPADGAPGHSNFNLDQHHSPVVPFDDSVIQAHRGQGGGLIPADQKGMTYAEEHGGQGLAAWQSDGQGHYSQAPGYAHPAVANFQNQAESHLMELSKKLEYLDPNSPGYAGTLNAYKELAGIVQAIHQGSQAQEVAGRWGNTQADTTGRHLENADHIKGGYDLDKQSLMETGATGRTKLTADNAYNMNERDNAAEVSKQNTIGGYKVEAARIKNDAAFKKAVTGADSDETKARIEAFKSITNGLDKKDVEKYKEAYAVVTGQLRALGGKEEWLSDSTQLMPLIEKYLAHNADSGFFSGNDEPYRIDIPGLPTSDSEGAY